eukprot:465988-Hanusia_phi.AAC.1
MIIKSGAPGNSAGTVFKPVSRCHHGMMSDPSEVPSLVAETVRATVLLYDIIIPATLSTVGPRLCP